MLIRSSEKAKKEIGFKFEYSLEEGLKKLIDWREKKRIKDKLK